MVNSGIMGAFEALERTALKLRLFAQALILATLLNLVIAMVLVSGIYPAFDRFLNLNFSMIPPILGIFVVMVAFSFDSLKKDGNAYFEELSDELHGKKLKNISTNDDDDDDDFSLKARVIIRQYSNSTSIPLIPGKYGPAFIALINIIFSFFSTFMITRGF